MRLQTLGRIATHIQYYTIRRAEDIQMKPQGRLNQFMTKFLNKVWFAVIIWQCPTPYLQIFVGNIVNLTAGMRLDVGMSYFFA